MYTKIIWLCVIIGIATSQQEENAGEKTQTGNQVDEPLNEETDAATDALTKYLGFSCPMGHRCLPVLDCLPCEYGTYKDNDGSALCKKCPPDCTTLRKGAQSREECVPFCPPGYERSQCGQTCTKCRPRTYKSSWNGTELCMRCPENSTPSEDALGLADVEQCYSDGEDPGDSTTASDQTSSQTGPQSTPQETTVTGSTDEWSTFSGTLSTETSSLTEPTTMSDTMTTDETSTLSASSPSDTASSEQSSSATTLASTQPDECQEACPLPPPKESKLCSGSVNQLFGCLNRCRAVKDAVAELNEARQSVHSAVKNKLTNILNVESDWTEILAWFYRACPGYTTSYTTSTTTTETPPTTSSETTSSSTTTETAGTTTSSTTTSTAEITTSDSTSSTTTVTLDTTSSESTSSSTETTATPTSEFTTTSSTATVTDFTEETTTAAETTSRDPQSTAAPERTPPPEQLSTVVCSQDTECGLGGKCYGDRCGCLTTSCSGVAYAAMQGCQYFCHCNDATKKWEIQPCSPGTLFDEMYPGTCNFPYLVGNETCYQAMDCEIDNCVMPAASVMCDLFVRNYTRCLRSLYVKCGRHPLGEHNAQETNKLASDVVYNELRGRLQTYEEDVEQFYINYMTQCFGYTSSDTTSTTTTETPPTTSSETTSSSTTTETPGTTTSSTTTSTAEITTSDSTSSTTTVTLDTTSSESTSSSTETTATPTSEFTTTSSTATVTDFTEETTTAAETTSGDPQSTAAPERTPPPEQLSTGNEVMHNSLDDFEYRPDPTTDYGISCSLVSEKSMYNRRNVATLAPSFFIGSSFLQSVVCSQDTECGLGGKCYGGRCGCLTTSCSGVAYAAMQGCQYFCQCNDATKKWEIQKCSPGTLFDEMYPATCNFPYLVGNETCYHAMDCEIDNCVMPAASVMCDMYVRNYTRCLRSLFVKCGRHPLDEHIAQETSQLASDVMYNALRERLQSYGEDVEQFYINYMAECFEMASLTGA